MEQWLRVVPARRCDRGAAYAKVAFLFDIEMTRQRLAILEQLDAGLARYAEVVQLVAAADDRAAARLAIIELLDCGEMAARAITDTTFEQLTKQRRGEMTAEIERLRRELG